MMIFAVTATTMTVPFLCVKMLLRDFNMQSGLSSGFSAFWVVFAKATFGKIKSTGFSQPGQKLIVRCHSFFKEVIICSLVVVSLPKYHEVLLIHWSEKQCN